MLRSLVRNISSRRYSSKSTDEPKKINLEYKLERLKTLEKQGKFHYPHQFKPNTSIESFLDKYMYLDRGQSLQSDNGIQMCGRIHSIREMGKNLLFIDLHQSEFRVQVKAIKNNYEDNFHEDVLKLARGDVIGITDGHPSKTKAGELSIVPKKIHLLSPCLKTLPTTNITEMSYKYRRRHVDLMLNPQSRAIYYARAKVIRSIRKFLEERDFLEVETPILDTGKTFSTYLAKSLIKVLQLPISHFHFRGWRSVCRSI